MEKRVAVVGGGISGLCVAYRLKKAGVDVALFESSGTVGGNIRSETRDGFLIEHGPNTALANRALVDLIDDLGIRGEIAHPDSKAKWRYILKNGSLAALPSGSLDILHNTTFSTKAKLRLLKEPFIGTRSPPDESVSAFFERRIGKELVDYAVDPFISGIYAGDPNKLSIRHAFPRLFEYERDFGSIVRGAIFTRKNKAVRVPKAIPRSITFKSGMQTLSDALAEVLHGNVRLNTSVTTVDRCDSVGFAVHTAEGNEVFGAVVIATPADVAARLIEKIDASHCHELANIYYPPVSLVFTAFLRDRVKTNPDGFGFLVPSVERRKILGSLWTSSVFENRAPDDYHLFTTFVGGSRNAELCDNSDSDLQEIAVDELRSILGIEGDPVFASIKKWDRAIPQYNIGFERVIEAIEEFQGKHPGIYFCSNFYNGISVGDCVRNAQRTAEEIARHLFDR